MFVFQTHEIFGFIGGILLGFQLIPQIIKAVQTKSTSDISIYFLFVSLLGSAFTVVYGIYIWSLSLVITISISFISKIVLISLKLYYDKKALGNTA